MSGLGSGGWRVIVLAALLLCALAGAVHAAPPRDVFIYYANENAPDEAEMANYRTIIAWLRSAGRDKLDRLADSFERDMRDFPAAVDQDIAIVQRQTFAWSSAPPAVVFTNRGVRSGRFWILRPGAGRVENVAMDAPRYDNLILASNPLTTAESLARCLHEVVRRFPADRHQYVLVAKSHGSEVLALTPRLVVRSDDVSREAFLTFANATEPVASAPAWAKRLGTTREAFFAVLADAGQTAGMRFPLVFVESCQGVLDSELKLQLPRNVGRFYTTGWELARYRNVDYAAVFQRCEQGASLAAALEEQLAAKYPGITRSSFWQPWHFAIFSAPFLAWSVWIVARFLVRRNGTRR